MKRFSFRPGRAVSLLCFLGLLGAGEARALPAASSHADLVHKLVDGYFVGVKIRGPLEGVMPDWEKRGNDLAEPVASLQREIAQIREDAKAGLCAFDDETQVTLAHARVLADFARLRSIFSRLQSALGDEASAAPTKEILDGAVSAIAEFLSPPAPE